MVEPEVMAALVPRFRSKITNHDSQGDNRAGAIETRYGHSLSYGYPRNYSWSGLATAGWRERAQQRLVFANYALS